MCYNSRTMNLSIAFLASEVAPFAKTGGLADVAGALPRALAGAGTSVRVLMPFYREVKKKNLPVRKLFEDSISDGMGRSLPYAVHELDEAGVSTLFIEHDAFFDREFLYGTPAGDYPDNGERFAFFARAALETLAKTGMAVDIVHAHDWQSAPALAYLKFLQSGNPFFARTRTVFTIHNLAYQGRFEKDILGRIGLPDSLFNMNDLEFYGKVNFLKAGILYADAVTTVSPRYSREIQTPEFGCGLDGLLRQRSGVLRGILNGVDYAAWDPARDVLIPSRYGPGDLAGKAVCKKEIIRMFGLPAAAAGRPVVGVVSRLAGQKGFDLVADALDEMFKRNFVLIVLGTGEDKIQEALKAAQKAHPDRFGLKIAFDEKVAHTIYAGSDVFLIPSRYEPCGLTQMYSLKYGTIPVVRATGGLDDTIREFDPAARTGNGFKFEAYTEAALLACLDRALAQWKNKSAWSVLVRNAMAEDFSWGRSAQAYLDLYRSVANG
jgi:starch synthase